MYDYLMTVPEDHRAVMYANLNLINFQKTPADVKMPETFWADQAYQLSGGGQSVYDSIMGARVEYRPIEFFLWATYDFNKSKTKFNPLTHWGDKAYQIGKGGKEGQENYDFIMGAKPEDRSERFIELADHIDDCGKTHFNYVCDI